MRTIGALPKSVLMLEIIGMVLLSLALLSLNDYLTLPAPLGSPLACVVMIFLGVLLMSRTPGDSSRSDREKRDDANH